uniref:S5A_REDUCTASE domain-containing protein n=1 Tax=Rhabditophanes sp. KR3021 TaxID=114890 RepID=A0AC35TLX4_9BILA
MFDRLLFPLTDNADVINMLCMLYVAFGVITAICLLGGIKAQYGRYNGGALNKNFVLNPKLSWFLQEIPSLAFPVFFVFKYSFLDKQIILGLFRALIYPINIKSGRPVPFEIFFAAFTFCVVNGYLQGNTHLFSIYYPSDHFFKLSTLFGIVLFGVGFFINLQADSILRNLRKPKDDSYKIPTGGLFDYVSGANYFGEIIEWIGFVFIAGSTSSLAFAFFTLCNVGPRAIQHHNWYKKTFEDYPVDRKALIPFLI